MKEVKGGTPYGAATYSTRGEPIFLESMHANDHGFYFANVTKQLTEATTV